MATNPNYLPVPFVSGFGSNSGNFGAGAGPMTQPYAPAAMPAPMGGAGLSATMNSAFSMPKGATPDGWFGFNGLSPEASKSGWLGIEGLGKNLDTLKLGIGGLQTIAGLWNASQQNKLAKQSFQYNKGLLDTNLANSITAYNTNVDDKYRSRAVVEGMSNADRDAAIEKAKARDNRKG